MIFHVRKIGYKEGRCLELGIIHYIVTKVLDVKKVIYPSHPYALAYLNCKTPENSNFLKNNKMVISVQIQNFSRSRMTKQTSPLESSCEI